MTADLLGGRSLEERLSEDPEVERLARRALDRSVQHLATSPASDRIVGILLGGSAATGDAVGWRRTDGSPLELVLSDLDLAVVLRSPIPADTRSRVESQVRALGESLEPAVGVTVGWYLESHLTRQAPTPGLVDLACHGRVCLGSPGLPARFGAPPPEKIPSREAWRLVGNRALELLATDAPESPDRLTPVAAHALAKGVIDLWTAWLILRGSYVSGMRRRLAGLAGASAESAPPELLRSARAWSEFRARPIGRAVPAGELGLACYARALGALVRAEAAHSREPWEVIVGESVGLRDRFRRWRDALARADARTRSRLVRAAFRGGGGGWNGRQAALGTPESRWRAVAVMYWLVSSERASGADDVWARATTELIGQVPSRDPADLPLLRSTLGIGT